LYGQQLKVFSQVYKYCYQNNIVVESGRYKTSEDDFCAGACVLTPKPGLYDNVVSFDFCLTGDTLVSMSTGCSRRLDSLILNESVLGMDQSSGLRLNHFETVRGLQVKGLRETVKLVLQDGQTIVCTPDHKIMTPQGEWVRADSLKGGYVLRGLEHPEDTTCPLEEDWAITIGKTPKMTLNMKEWREHTLALCRILGYTNLHTRVTFETLFDAQAFLNDIQRFDETTVIEESKHGVRYFINFRSGVLGVERLSFLMDPKCPLSLIREFLAGLFGGYSHDSCRMENIYLKGVSKSLINLKGLLRRLSIRSKIEEPYLFIEHSSIRDFVRAIGFRYAVRKTRKATIRMHEKLWNDEELGVEEWFVPEPRDFLDPTLYYRRKVVDVVPNGLQSVFDIEVQTAHSFVANGVVVSNCSLYPSIIISHNIDFTTLIPEDSKVELPTEQYRTIAWEEHINCKCPHATLTKDTKDVRCRKYQYRWLSEQPGVLPTIIKNLLQARKDVRNQMKTMDKSSLLYDILNKRQLAYKVSSNSMYGALSAKKGYLPFLPAGMCVTAVGRQSIEKVSKIIQEEHQGKVVYGDSVTGETPVLLRDPETQEIFVRAIGQLTSGDWFEYPGFKYFDTTIRLEKQYSKTNYEVWSDKGWTPIRRVIRHKTQKDIYTVCTRLGIVRVTEDHSLLNAAGKRLKPKDVEPGTELLHRFPEFALSEEEMEPIDSILSEYIAQQHNLCFDTPTEAQQYYLLLKQLGLHPKVYLDRNKRYSLYIEHSSKPSDIRVVRIEKDDESTLEQFVYDLETECGHFQAGVGQMIVKNTDSNYVVFPQLNSLQDIWDHSIKVSDEVSKYFPEPMRLEFEDNIYARYLILSKKRYLYFSVTPDGKMSSKIENKGVLLKRRDNSKIVRDIYEHIIRMVLNREPQDKVITQVVEFVALLYSMVPSVEDFQMSKSVKTIEGFTVSYRDARTIQYGDYVVPRLKENPVDRAIQLQEKGVVSEEDFYQGHLPGAVQLALRMRSRGQHIESGSRLSYIVSRRNTGTSVADKMEEIEYFKRYYSKQMIDVQHYLHLLINPIEEVLIVMYGPRYKNFVKDMYKYRVKYNSVINQLFHLQRPMIWETTGK
jgi:DNA polymerase elongation subunit (family B)